MFLAAVSLARSENLMQILGMALARRGDGFGHLVPDCRDSPVSQGLDRFLQREIVGGAGLRKGPLAPAGGRLLRQAQTCPLCQHPQRGEFGVPVGPPGCALPN